MSTYLVARAIALLCLTSSAALASTIARTGCPGCTAPATIDSTHELVVRHARVAQHDGEWNRAADLWRSALLLDGRVAEHWVAMGDALSGAQRYHEAVAAYERSIQLDPRSARQGTRRVAGAYALMGNDKQAVRWLEQSVRAGAVLDDLLADELFERYRDEPRLRTLIEHHVDLRGHGLGRERTARAVAASFLRIAGRRTLSTRRSPCVTSSVSLLRSPSLRFSVCRAVRVPSPPRRIVLPPTV